MKRRLQLTLQQMRSLHQFIGDKVALYLLYALIVGVLLFIVEIVFAYVLQSFISILGITQIGNLRIPEWIPKEGLYQVLLTFLLLGIFRSILYWCQQYLPQAIMFESANVQRSRILHWVFQSKTASSSKTITLFNEWSNGTAYALMAALNLIIGLICATFLGLGLVYLAPVLTLFVGLFLLIFLLPLRRLDQNVSDSSKVVWSEWTGTYNNILRSIKNLLLIQIYGMQTLEESKAIESITRYRDHLLRHFYLAGFKFALPQLLGVIVISFIALVTQHFKSLSPGLLITYFYIFMRFVQNIAVCAQHSSALLTYRAPSESLLSWWKVEKPELIISAPSIPTSGSNLISSPIGWSLEDIHFRYPQSQEAILSNLSLKIEPRKAIVIRGPSGAGKSTLLNLLIGQVEPSSGAVHVEYDQRKHALRKVKESLLPSIGYVGPENFFIEGTIRENLLYGLPRFPTEDEIENVLELSQSHFVRGLSLGLNHPVSEQGTGLSAGQKQRLGFARALLRNPKALILDEATSNLDTDTERKLVRILGDLKDEITLIIVTHRDLLLDIADQRLDLKEKAEG